MLWFFFLLVAQGCWTTHSLLYPIESETRQIRSLNGLWQFRTDDDGVGEKERWFAMPNLPQPTISMPVPASFNDITQNISIYRYVGLVWYEKDFYIHNTASRWVLRFQAARYEAHVWVNGHSAVNHSGGHLPFEADITPFLPSDTQYSKVHVVVSVKNTLTPTTLPPNANLFYNYGGIDRSVFLYSTSNVYIDDITIDTQSIDYDAQHVPTSATLTYAVTISGTNQSNDLRVLIELLDTDGVVVANSTDLQSRLMVSKPHLWEPCGMNHTHLCTEESYLYTLQVTLANGPSEKDVIDIYRIPHVGIRTIRVTDSKFLVNERPFYFHGVNAHEDSDIRGKGFDNVILSKHFNLYGWLHGNSFRTSHYPYADEFYQMANRYGFGIIGESPAAGMGQVTDFSQTTLEHHKQVMVEMTSRDRNHPSVLMWSLANEPLSDTSEANAYFNTLFNFTRPIAAGRPLTFVTYKTADIDLCVQFADVVCINSYFAWYNNYGRLDQIPDALSQELINYRTRYPTKPIIASEFGAETLSGLHSDPPMMFTEEYQKGVYAGYHSVFDNCSSLLHPDSGYLIGELPWNMYEFAQLQSINNMAELNCKGIFTRQRQPKAVAFVVKTRYEQLELIPTSIYPAV